MTVAYPIRELREYIHWIYFFHAWNFQPRYAAIADIHGCDACRALWLANFPEAERAKAAESMQLFKEANRMLDELDGKLEIQAVFLLPEANSDGDDIIISGTRIPFLRQQVRHKADEPYLCLSDFIRPLSSGVKDTIGIFATSVTTDPETYCRNDSYKHLLLQTLSSRLAEAAAEKLHEYVRKEAWGYAKNEALSIRDMLAGTYQGIRPAVGYPSIPDQSVNFLLDELLDMKQIGITLTENGAMKPHASVSGFMIAHPQARYFAVGKIGHDQLKDYSLRRGIDSSIMSKFLADNLP